MIRRSFEGGAPHPGAPGPDSHAMLDSMRRHASGWIAKVLLGFLIVSFAIWGIGDMVRGGFRSDTVVTVGGSKVHARTVEVAYQRELASYQRRTGTALTREQAARLGVTQRVLDQVVTETTLDEAVRRKGLGVSDQELVRQISEDRAFQGAGGTFDRRQFAELLRQNGWSEDQYISERRRATLRQQLADGMLGGLAAPRAYLEVVNRFRQEERIVRTLTFDRAGLGDLPKPTDAELAAFFEPRKAAFRSAEYRKVLLVELSAETLAAREEVTDDDARREYERHGARYETPERRRVERIPFGSRADAEAAVAELKAGKTFDDLVAARNLKPEDISLGMNAKPAFIDQQIAEAAFKQPLNEPSGVVDGRFGAVVLRVTEIAPGGKTPFEEAKAAIKQVIARERADASLTDIRNQIEDLRAGGATLTEAAAKLKLASRVVEAIDRDGRDRAGAEVTGLPEAEKLIGAAFEADVKTEVDPVPLPGGGSLLFEVTEIVPAADRPLDAVRADVEARWTDEEVVKRLKARAEEARARIAKGEDVEAVATALGVEAKTTERLKRADRKPEIPAGVIAAAFSGPEGHVTVAPGTEEDQVVVVVQDIFEPAFFAEAPEVSEIAGGLGQDLQATALEGYVRRLQTDLGVTIDRSALDRAIGATGTN